MAHGFAIYDGAGDLLMSTADKTATLVEVIVLGASTPTGSHTYPDFEGYTISYLRVYDASGVTTPAEALHTITVTYPSGLPTLTYTKTTGTAKKSQIIVTVD